MPRDRQVPTKIPLPNSRSRPVHMIYVAGTLNYYRNENDKKFLRISFGIIIIGTYRIIGDIHLEMSITHA